MLFLYDLKVSPENRIKGGKAASYVPHFCEESSPPFSLPPLFWRWCGTGAPQAVVSGDEELCNRVLFFLSEVATLFP